jgi:nucleoside-diphosphate-sugar epimerase
VAEYRPGQGGSADRPPGSFRLDQLTRPGETQYNQVEHNFDVSWTENRLGADQRSRVLVTGGSGFIGRRLVTALLAGGADVTVADRHEPSAPGVRFVDGDLRDPAIAAQAVSPGTEVIVHLAAVTSVLRSVEDPAGTFEANVAGILLAWRASCRGPLILGAGEPVTVNDIIAAARAVTGAPIPVEYIPAKQGEMPAVIVDISAARALGYQPTHDLKSGLATVWPEFAPHAAAEGRQHSDES